MIPPLSGFRTFVFDCDGVVLDSNEIKTEVFRDVASEFGRGAADRLVEFHRLHGGISRFEKFRWLVGEVLGKPGEHELVERLARDFGHRVRDRLERCATCPGAIETLARCSSLGACFLVSGGLEDELCDVLRARRLDRFFRGIHGSPRTKRQIMAGIRDDGALEAPVVFFGDSRLDRDVAMEFGCDFVFLHGRTDMPGWRDWVRSERIPSASDLGAVLARDRRPPDRSRLVPAIDGEAP